MAARTLDGSGGYARPRDIYTWRPPSPPHIHIPQAPEDQKLVLPPYNPGTDVNHEVLKIITDGNHAEVATREWKYEWRRKAQPVLSFLHLGPSAAARDVAYLKEEGITLLLAIRDSRSAQARLLSGEKVANQLGIESTALDVASYQELIRNFPRTTEVINNHLVSQYYKHLHDLNNDGSPRTTWGKVLVFCESGNERSACVVAAYLMNMYGMGLIPALQYVQTQRFCVAFDDSTKNLLQNYQDIVSAKAAVTSGANTQQTFVDPNIYQPKPKRGRECIELDDESMDLDDADDRSRFDGRTSFIPFTDDAPVITPILNHIPL